MPIFYNSAPPTPTTKNTINSIAVDYGIRDFLLNLNLLPKYPQITTSLNGSPRIGEPVLDTIVNTGANVIPNGLPLETEGILWKELIIVTNKFKNNNSNANDLKTIDYIQDIANTNFGESEWPEGVQYPTYENPDVEKYGIIGKTKIAGFRKTNTIKNLYLDESKQIDMANFIDLQPNDISQQINGYLDTYGGLNLGGSGAVQAANVIGSIVNGQGLGLAKGGVVTNFDVRSSLAGRVLGATGLIKDTKLGQIGGQQLALALANNAAFNLQQDILGALNIKDNILSLVKGEGFAAFPRPNYTITVPEGNIGRILNYASSVLGFTLPRSFVTDAGSIFQSESGEVDNISRANSLINTTGKGQLQALLTNMNANLNGISPLGIDNPNYSGSSFRSGYAPGYKNSNKKSNDDKITANMYAFQNGNDMVNLFNKKDSKGDETIPVLSYNRDIKQYGFAGPDDTEDPFVGHTGGQKGYDEKTVKTVGFSWGSEIEGLVNTDPNYSALDGNKKSLLVKTQKLFNSFGMKSIVTAKGDMNKQSSQLEQSNGFGFSKGNAVMKEALFTQEGYWTRDKNKTAAETYCRSWTTLDRYDNVQKLVRNDALYPVNKVPFRNIIVNSVLEDTGFVKVVPYRTDFDKPKDEVTVDAKRYMLSIENLAWADKVSDLPKGEVGPGDLITGKQGRIMWFPPYDIAFSESTSVEWENNKFIGRGEPIYTYNNTERTGQLSFKIIVDHSTYTNAFRGINGPDDHYVASFMAGCIEPNSFWTDRFTSSQISEMNKKENRIPQKKQDPKEPPLPSVMSVYFPNDNVEIDKKYENGLSGATTANTINYDANPNGEGFGVGRYPSNYTPGATNDGKGDDTWPDRYNFGLNYNGKSTKESTIKDKNFKGIYSPGYFDALGEYLKNECKYCKATVNGYASAQGTSKYNEKLAKDRASKIIELYVNELSTRIGKSKADTQKIFTVGKTGEISASESADLEYEGKKYKATKSTSGCIVCKDKSVATKKIREVICPEDQLGCKIDRRADVTWTFDTDAALADIAPPEDKIEIVNETITTKIKEKFYNETMFFDKLIKTDSFIFDKFREKIKYFHPAFHSTTPEGFNSRLTFLQQCTRQGPTDNLTTNNLAFGRPPICILRIGDFYHTKIVIDSVQFDYEPLVWDLNPEGIGVQPMIANVSLSFKFLGGESMYGPINKLQNALSFNYFANTHVYEARADYISKTSDVSASLKGQTVEQVSEFNKGVAAGLTGEFLLVNGRKSVDPEIKTVTTTEAPQENPQNQEKANEAANSGTDNQTQQPETTGSTKTNKEKTIRIASGTSFGTQQTCKNGKIKVTITSTVNIEVDDGGFDKEFTAVFSIYDAKQKPHEIQRIIIPKGVTWLSQTDSRIVLEEPEFAFSVGKISPFGKFDIDYRTELKIKKLNKKAFSEQPISVTGCDIGSLIAADTDNLIA